MWPRKSLVAAAAFAALLCVQAGSVSPARALPEGGEVVEGSAEIILVSPERLDIIQISDRAIIDWRSFSIALGEHTDFQMPSADALVLNRVMGGVPSEILGRLSANGQVILVNPNDVVFGESAQVDVAGILVSTIDIANQDFLAGRYNFNILINPLGLIVNRGTITVAEGGLAALVAPGVENSGVIEVRLGRVALASGNAFTLDLYGDRLVSLAVDDRVSQQVLGLDGAPRASLVENSGRISADGGTVLITAEAARGVVDNVINMSGVIDARTVAERNGEIVLLGGSEGVTRVAGTLDASGAEAGERGGTVIVLGDKVGLFEQAEVNTSGDVGGGQVLIGGDYKGQGDLPTASRTYVAPDATINADAVTNGDGGRVIVWADEGANVYGGISARGGQASGAGGLVETSAKELRVTRTPDISAPNGSAGQWLIDPFDIEIAAGAGNDNINNTSPFESTGEGASLGVDLIKNALTGGANVTIITGAGGAQAGKIEWGAALDYDGTGTNTLSLSAQGNIDIVASISDSSATGTDKLNLTLTADSDGSGAGNIEIAADIKTKGGDFTASAVNFENTTGGKFGATGQIDASDGAAGGDISITATSAEFGDTLTTAGSGDITVTLAAGNLLGIKAAITAASGDITLTTDLIELDAATTSTSGDITVQPTSGAVTVGIGNLPTGTLNLLQAEMDNLGTTGLVTIGRDAATGAFDLNDLDLSAESFDLTLNGGDFTFDQLTLPDNQTLRVRSSGKLTDTNVGTNNITVSGTGTLLIDAANGIASSSSDPLEINVATLAARVRGSGSIFFAEANDLVLGAVTNGFGGDTISGLATSGSSINISATGNLTQSSGQITTDNLDLNVGGALSASVDVGSLTFSAQSANLAGTIAGDVGQRAADRAIIRGTRIGPYRMNGFSIIGVPGADRVDALRSGVDAVTPLTGVFGGERARLSTAVFEQGTFGPYVVAAGGAERTTREAELALEAQGAPALGEAGQTEEDEED